MSGYELVMPFVSVASKGGPYDDDAYAAGWAMGRLDAVLAVPWLQTHGETVRAADARQAELVAMKNGFLSRIRESEVDGWVYVEFSRPNESETP